MSKRHRQIFNAKFKLQMMHQDYDAEKSQIEEIAKSSGVQIESEIRLEKIQDDFLCHFPS